MSRLSFEDMKALAASAGFPDPALAAAVAMAESGGDPNAKGDTGPGVAGPSIGLWQIDLAFHKQWSEQELYDPATNARAALTIYRAASSTFEPWSTAWEDPKHRVGYLGPKAPVRKWWSPPSPPEPQPVPASRNVTGVVVGSLVLAGVTYLIVKG